MNITYFLIKNNWNQLGEWGFLVVVCFSVNHANTCIRAPHLTEIRVPQPLRITLRQMLLTVWLLLLCSVCIPVWWWGPRPSPRPGSPSFRSSEKPLTLLGSRGTVQQQMLLKSGLNRPVQSVQEEQGSPCCRCLVAWKEASNLHVDQAPHIIDNCKGRCGSQPIQIKDFFGNHSHPVFLAASAHCPKIHWRLRFSHIPGMVKCQEMLGHKELSHEIHTAINDSLTMC